LLELNCGAKELIHEFALNHSGPAQLLKTIREMLGDRHFSKHILDLKLPVSVHPGFLQGLVKVF
jgi:hypothetical protein